MHCICLVLKRCWNILFFLRKNYLNTHSICIIYFCQVQSQTNASSPRPYCCLTCTCTHRCTHWVHVCMSYLCTKFPISGSNWELKKIFAWLPCYYFRFFQHITLIKVAHSSKLSLHIITRSYGTSSCFCHVIIINDRKKQKVWHCGVLRWYNLQTNRLKYTQSMVIS